MSKAFTEAGDLDGGLREVARLYIGFVIRPEVLRLRRLVLGEAGRFSDLARTYYESVPERVYAALAAHFKELADSGTLRLDDPMLAAHHFAWLTLGQPRDLGMFCETPATAQKDLNRLADAARVFLAAYRAG